MKACESSNRRRSQRVSLQVAVLMRVNMPDERCVQVQAFTSLVNAHGGLLESPIKLETNQKMVLINPHSGNNAVCRVVQVVGPASAFYDVAFEFDQRNPGFWLLDFPPEDWTVKEETASDNRGAPP